MGLPEIDATLRTRFSKQLDEVVRSPEGRADAEHGPADGSGLADAEETEQDQMSSLTMSVYLARSSIFIIKV